MLLELIKKRKPTVSEVIACAKEYIMMLYIVSKHFSYEVPFDELGIMTPEYAYFLEKRMLQLLVKEKLSKQYSR